MKDCMELRLQNELDRITELLTDLSRFVYIKKGNQEYTILATLEKIMGGLFNIVFDCNLENLNYHQRNYPAVDLGDSEKKIAVQITTEDISTKMDKVLKRVKENKIYQCYDDIYIFFYTEKAPVKSCKWLKQENIDKVTKPEYILPKDHILFMEDIYRILYHTKDLNEIIMAREYLESHLRKPEEERRKSEEERRRKIGISEMLCGIGFLLVIFLLAVFLRHPSDISPEINMEMYSHLLLELENANHQYEEGLENWRRLDYNRAEREIRKAGEEISKHLSQAEIEMAKINNSLGCLYLDMGKYEEAYDYLNRAYITFKDTYGRDSVEVRAVRFSIAQYDYYMGDYETALRMTQEILDDSDQEKDIVIIASIHHFWAMIFDSLGDYDSAISNYREVLFLYGVVSEDGELSKDLSEYVNDPQLDQREKDYYTNTLKRIILTYNNMGQAYIHLEKYEEAEKVLQKGIELSLDNIYIKEQNLTCSRLYCNLAIAEAKQGQEKEALDYIDLAMRIQKKLFDYEDDYPGLVEVYDIYGELLMEQGKEENSKDYFERALKLAEKSFGENHPHTAEAYYALGIYQYNGGKYTEAAELFDKAIEIRKNILGKEHPYTVKYYIGLAKSQLRISETDKAAVSLREAEEICNKFNIKGSLPEQIKEYQKEIM